MLITPARNEGAFIKMTLDSVFAQPFRPSDWVIVDDGSSDNTAEIVAPFAEQVSNSGRCEQRPDRNFAGKVYAFKAGLERVQSIDFEIISNLDADVSFDADHL